jgi:hypothetical protein
MSSQSMIRPLRIDRKPLTEQVLRDVVAALDAPRAIHCGIFVKALLRRWGLGDDGRFRAGEHAPLVTNLYHQKADVIHVFNADGELLAWIEGFSVTAGDYLGEEAA